MSGRAGTSTATGSGGATPVCCWPLGGLASFMFFCVTQFDDAFAFATVQKAPGMGPGRGAAHLAEDRVPRPHRARLAGVLDAPRSRRRLLTVAFLLGSLLVLRRFGWGYAVYAFAIVPLPMLGTADFQGMGRYLLGCFPVFAAAGDWLAAPTPAGAATRCVCSSAR